MAYILNILISISGYMLIPLLIRYAIYRKPIPKNWIAVCILLPILLFWGIKITTVKMEQKRTFYKTYGLTGSPITGFGSPLLFVCMGFSFYILRRGSKESYFRFENPFSQSDSSDKKKNSFGRVSSDWLKCKGSFGDDKRIVLEPDLSSEDLELELLRKTQEEIDSGKVDKGLWAKAVMKAEGDQGKTAYYYMKSRVESLRKLYGLEQERKLNLEVERSAKLKARAQEIAEQREKTRLEIESHEKKQRVEKRKISYLIDMFGVDSNIAAVILQTPEIVSNLKSLHSLDVGVRKNHIDKCSSMDDIALKKELNKGSNSGYTATYCFALVEQFKRTNIYSQFTEDEVLNLVEFNFKCNSCNTLNHYTKGSNFDTISDLICSKCKVSVDLDKVRLI